MLWQGGGLAISQEAPEANDSLLMPLETLASIGYSTIHLSGSRRMCSR